jgi:hypothetical protein
MVVSRYYNASKLYSAIEKGKINKVKRIVKQKRKYIDEKSQEYALIIACKSRTKNTKKIVDYFIEQKFGTEPYSYETIGWDHMIKTISICPASNLVLLNDVEYIKNAINKGVNVYPGSMLDILNHEVNNIGDQAKKEEFKKNYQDTIDFTLQLNEQEKEKNNKSNTKKTKRALAVKIKEEPLELTL